MRKLMLACAVMSMAVLLVGGIALAVNFRGTDGPDEISGTKRADAIRGLGGNDRLSGSGGDDHVYGGGSDEIRGNNGDDRLMADDGKEDDVWCGSGTDYVYADVRDTVYYGCETVER